jgi:hypothetical protein
MGKELRLGGQGESGRGRKRKLFGSLLAGKEAGLCCLQGRAAAKLRQLVLNL